MELRAKRTRRGKLARGVALAAVSIAFATACLHGIADDWRIGHDGYNGAGFCQAARNTLRFGVLGQAREHTGLDPPSASDLYTNHPIGIHLHLVALHGLFGFDEAVGRAMPAVYSMGILVLLVLMGRAFADAWTALAAAALLTLTPLSLIFSSMIDHEQPAIFWCLACLFAFLRHEQTGERRHRRAALVALAVACQLDWPALVLAFFLAVRALVHGGRVEPGVPLRARAGTRTAAAVGAVTLASLAVIVVLIVTERGGLSHMVDAYAGRIRPNGPYLPVLAQRLVDLHGLPVLLLAPWAALAVRRARAATTEPLDVAVSALLFMQAVHIAAFTGAAYNHSYWTYYLTPAVAIGGALTLRDVARWAMARGRTVTALTVVVGALLAGFQARYAWQQLRWGVETGHAAYMPDYDPGFAEVAWVKDLARRYPRPTTAFVLDPSVRARRMELSFYLDGPITTDLRQPLDPHTAGRVQHRLVLLDLYRLDDDPGYTRYLAHLVAAHRVEVWDRHLTAIDLAGGPTLSAFRSVEEPRPWWWCWLVSPDRPRVHWEPDPDLAVVRDRLAVLAEAGGG